MNRGDRREPNFRDEADRMRFLETLGETCAKTVNTSTPLKRNSGPMFVFFGNKFEGSAALTAKAVAEALTGDLGIA